MLLARSMLPVAALGVTLSAFPRGSLIAQPSLDGSGQRGAAESFLVQLRMSARDNPVTAAGLGGRLLWNIGNLLENPSALAQRTELGPYGAYLPKQNLSGASVFTAYRLGVAGNLRVFSTPFAGRIDPYISVGAGVWHSTADGVMSSTFNSRAGLKASLWDAGMSVTRPMTGRPALLHGSVTALEVVPGAGLRVPFGPAAAMELGVDNAVQFRNSIQHNVGVFAGLRFDF